MIFQQKTLDLATRVIQVLGGREMNICTAESCTGGLIAGALTAVPGSSAVVYGGFVTYANEAKMAMVDVPASILHTHGAVSEQTAWFMVNGARAASETDVAVAVTGIAGPGGGTREKPVGLVHLAASIAAEGGFETVHREMHYGDIGREKIRTATVDSALELVLQIVEA